MGGARFVFISDGRMTAGGGSGGGNGSGASGAAGATADGTDDRVWWRLVAANNRVLGRSIGSDRSEAACRQGAAELSVRVDDAVTALTTDERGRWTWSVALDSVERARCAHPFPRRVDCQRTLALFLQGARTADAHAGVVRYFAVRGHSGVHR